MAQLGSIIFQLNINLHSPSCCLNKKTSALWWNRTTSMTKMRSRSLYGSCLKVPTWPKWKFSEIQKKNFFRKSSGDNYWPKRLQNHSNPGGVGLWDKSEGKWSRCWTDHSRCRIAFRFELFLNLDVLTFSNKRCHSGSSKNRRICRSWLERWVDWSYHKGLFSELG